MVLQRRYLTVETATHIFWIFSALCFAKPLFFRTLVWSCSSKSLVWVNPLTIFVPDEIIFIVVLLLFEFVWYLFIV